ncbi:MAG: hypothetical protein ACSLE8_07290 [Rhodococcus sp. (in: high G+C Gram-positive bacteria)]
MDEDLSPAVIRKSVHLATKLPSFASAQESVAATIEVELTTKRVERLAKRIGQDRVQERELDVGRWDRLPLMQKLGAPPGVKPPQVACVSCDGGRMQRCDLPDEAKSHWCETKVGILLEWDAPEHEGDPCPELPDTFANLAKMDQLTREIHRVAAEKAAPQGAVFHSDERGADGAETVENATGPPDPIAQAREAIVFDPPELTARDVAASLSPSRDFGRQLAARAWSLGFAAAAGKAFVADGGSANWGIWDRHFKHLKFVPILDFIHALTYVYAAATAGRSAEEGGRTYLRWITWVWQGNVSQTIAELATQAAQLGPPDDETGETDPRQVVATTLTYLVNQQSRMNYPRYRRDGLPVTSSHIESTVKQINYRVKGSEKFWTDTGGEALLQLRADQLSDTQPLPLYWTRRAHNATGTRTYTKAA